MAYSKNPHLAKVRMEAVRLVKWRGWSTRQAARYTGFAQGTIVKWCQRVFAVVLPLQNWFYGIILAQFLKYSLILSLKSIGTSVRIERSKLVFGRRIVISESDQLKYLAIKQKKDQGN